MDVEFNQALEAMEAQIEMMQTRILERIEQMEIRLLSAFDVRDAPTEGG